MGLQLHLSLSICSSGYTGDVSDDYGLHPWRRDHRIASGDQSAMRALFARYRVALYRWLLRLVDDRALAEDLLSEVFLDVWRRAACFEARSSVSTWLLAIARY